MQALTTWWRQESTRRGRTNTDRTLHHETQPHRSCAAPGDATPPTECAHSTLQPVSMQQTKTTGTPPSPAHSSPRRKHERRVPSISADATPIDHYVTHGPRARASGPSNHREAHRPKLEREDRKAHRGRKSDALPCARASSIFIGHFQTSAALVSVRSISDNWASHPRRGSPSPTSGRCASGGQGGERQLKKTRVF